VEQFDGAGEIESGKAVFEIISPVSGTITRVNDRLMDKPELINENPYEQGWIAEIELSDFEADKDLLHEFDDYFPILKRKADEYNAKS
jgi:glycine cleavage system H protein